MDRATFRRMRWGGGEGFWTNYYFFLICQSSLRNLNCIWIDAIEAEAMCDLCVRGIESVEMQSSMS